MRVHIRRGSPAHVLRPQGFRLSLESWGRALESGPEAERASSFQTQSTAIRPSYALRGITRHVCTAPELNLTLVLGLRRAQESSPDAFQEHPRRLRHGAR